MKISMDTRPVAETGEGWGPRLAPGETLLWSGRPAYGLPMRELVGYEKVWARGFFVGAGVMWMTLPLIGDEGPVPLSYVSIVYGVATLTFTLLVLFSATTRARTMRQFHYAVTERRAIVCVSA